ncbi:methyltransferase domain protein [Ostertagia ostertagi]
MGSLHKKFSSGCGEAKYTCSTALVLGVDTCADALIGRTLKTNDRLDLLLADALTLPFRDNTADAVLNVSVLHHLSTATRRKAALEECARCLRPGGRMLAYVWAYEQPNGSFPSQDLLVPWNLSEIPINDSVNTSTVYVCEARWNPLLVSPPPAAPKFLPNAKQSLITGVKRWSPMLGRRLATLLISVEEQLADEITQKILHEALTETMASLREVTFYRFYHVFRKGELESLVHSIPSLSVVHSSFEHGNWCVVVEKVAG